MTPQSENQAARAAQARYWHSTRRLTLQLLLAWFVSTFAIIFFARELSGFTLFGWPFSFYMAAQGSTLIYVFIVGLYAWRMRRLDQTLKSDDSHAR